MFLQDIKGIKKPKIRMIKIKRKKKKKIERRKLLKKI